MKKIILISLVTALSLMANGGDKSKEQFGSVMQSGQTLQNEQKGEDKSQDQLGGTMQSAQTLKDGQKDEKYSQMSEQQSQEKTTAISQDVKSIVDKLKDDSQDRHG